MIWYKEVSLADLEKRHTDTMVSYLGIEITEIGPDFLKGFIPVNRKTCQPLGILHGGASVVLAESLGSVAANLAVDWNKYYCVGLDINANHIRPAPVGEKIEGITRPIHLGKKTQVWEIKMFNSQKKLTCISRLTMAVLEK